MLMEFELRPASSAAAKAFNLLPRNGFDWRDAAASAAAAAIESFLGRKARPCGKLFNFRPEVGRTPLFLHGQISKVLFSSLPFLNPILQRARAIVRHSTLEQDALHRAAFCFRQVRD